MTEKFDTLIVGGGIVGLATAYVLQQELGGRIGVLEKEAEPGLHQTGHNSGVLHSGIYYKPGSLKAQTCRAGKAEMEAFCREHDVDFKITGKVIVATEESELPRLQDLYDRGVQNGVRCEIVDAKRLRELEPHAAGIRAIHVAEAGVVNYKHVIRALADSISRKGGALLTKRRAERIEQSADGVRVTCADGSEVRASRVVNCAGLHSDRVASLSGADKAAQILPFRGEYYLVRPSAAELCRALIYPVPDPRFPFLGVHCTRSVEGEVECGPNAVLAFAREGYRKRDVSPRDLAEIATYGGFWRMAARYWRVGIGEMWRSFSRRAFLKAVQRLVPDLRDEHLEPAPAGVRAQAVAPTGALVDDFAITTRGRVVNVINAPSPAATASLAIARHIAGALRTES